MKTLTEIRIQRVGAEISASMLAAKAGINRSSLSEMEHGYIQPTEAQLQRLATALDELIHAKDAMQKAAIAVGWPTIGLK